MKIPEDHLRRLKRSTSEALREAQASGDPYWISEAKKNDELADELLQKNSQPGGLTPADMLRVASLISNIDRIIEFLANFPWGDLL